MTASPNKKRFNYDSKKLALSGILLAFALIISLLENMLPPIIPALPYAKIGLSNIVLLACFLLVGVWEGYVVLLLKCLLAAVFSGNLSMMIWSLPSALVAYTAMVLLFKTRLFSITGLSMAGGMLHNFTQILVATLVVGKSVFAYLPYMLLAGGLAGLATGIICHFLLKAVNLKLAGKRNYNEDLQSAETVADELQFPFKDAENSDGDTGNNAYGTENIDVADKSTEHTKNFDGEINDSDAGDIDEK